MSTDQRGVVLSDLQTLYWPTERAERELLPLMLFKGSSTLGKIQGWWNIVQVLKKMDVLTTADAARYMQEHGDVTHSAGLHLTASEAKLPSGIGTKLNNLANRVMSAPDVQRVDPDTADYLQQLMAASRRQVFRLDPISRWTERTKSPWRRQITTHGPQVALNPSWPFIPENSGREQLDGADLLRMVDELVPRTLPAIVREDVCQDIVLSLLMGEVTSICLQERVGDYVKDVFRKFPVKYGHLSLDQPAPWSRNDTRTLKEMLVAP